MIHRLSLNANTCCSLLVKSKESDRSRSNEISQTLSQRSQQVQDFTFDTKQHLKIVP